MRFWINWSIISTGERCAVMTSRLVKESPDTKITFMNKYFFSVPNSYKYQLDSWTWYILRLPSFLLSSLLFQIFKQYHRMNPQQLQQRFHAVYLKYVEMRKKMQDYYKSNAPKEAEVQKDYVKWVEWSRFIIYFIYSFDLFYLPIYFKEQM